MTRLNGPAANWFKQECIRISNDEKFLDLLCRVAKGEESETIVYQKVDNNGNVVGNKEVRVSKATLSDRLKAVEMILAYAYGRPAQTIDLATKKTFSIKLFEVPALPSPTNGNGNGSH